MGTATPTSRPNAARLPKLQLRYYNGELTKWTSFWQSFEAAVDCNPDLSGVENFNYLSSLFEGVAREAIAGLSLTEANYKEAVATLKKRFGGTQRRSESKSPLTATTLVTKDSPFGTTPCCYCHQQHRPTECTVVVRVDERKQLLRRAGRCFPAYEGVISAETAGHLTGVGPVKGNTTPAFAQPKMVRILEPWGRHQPHLSRPFPTSIPVHPSSILPQHCMLTPVNLSCCRQLQLWSPTPMAQEQV